MKEYKSAIWIVSFLIIVASPVFTYFFLGEYVDTGNYENRNLTSRPVLTTKNYETFPKEYETYYNDNLPFRNQLIRLNNSIDYFIFKQSSNESVVIGKDGWLFYSCSTDGNPVEQSLGYWDFTVDQLQTIADNLMATKRVLESRNIEFVLFIAPNKETIYMDKLPDYYEARSSYISTEQLVDYLTENTDIRIVYSKEDLMKAKEENPEIILYHKLDTHWNCAGGYIGARSLAEELKIDMPPFSEILLEPVLSSGGDLTNMLNIAVKDGDIDYNVSGISTSNPVREKGDFDAEFIYHTDGADPRKLFVMVDSFSHALAPAAATQFEDSIWVHRKKFNQQQIFDYDANIFVLEIVERYVATLSSFRVSFVSHSVESEENGMKRITIMPAIRGTDLSYILIYKKTRETDSLRAVQKIKQFDEPLVLYVPDNETGEFHIDIYDDNLGDKILENVIIEY